MTGGDAQAWQACLVQVRHTPKGLQDHGQRKRWLCGFGSRSSRMCWNRSRGRMGTLEGGWK